MRFQIWLGISMRSRRGRDMKMTLDFAAYCSDRITEGEN
jgi:hypothetical protein